MGKTMFAIAGSPLKQEKEKVRKWVKKTGMNQPSDFHPKVDDFNTNSSNSPEQINKKGRNMFEIHRQSQGIAGSGLGLSHHNHITELSHDEMEEIEPKPEGVGSALNIKPCAGEIDEQDHELPLI